jgi:hypothetical protein
VPESEEETDTYGGAPAPDDASLKIAAVLSIEHGAS